MNNENNQLTQGVNPQNVTPNSQPVQNNNVETLDANAGQVVPEQPVVGNPGLGEQPVAPVVNSTPQQNDFVGQDAAQSVPQQNNFMGQSVPQQNDFVGQNIGQNMPQPSFNEVAPQIQPQVVTEKKTTKNGVSILGVILISIIVAGLSILGTLYLTGGLGNKKSSSNSNTNTTTSTDNKSDDKSNSTENKDDTNNTSKKVTAGTDTNTSGKTVLDTLTATIVLNKENYDFKIELLDATGSTNKNVYINGYKVVADQPVGVGGSSVSTDAKTVLNDELQSLRVIKDTATEDEYVIYLEKNGEIFGSDTSSGLNLTSYLYIFSASGKTIGKFESDSSTNGFSILTNNLPTISNYKEITGGDYKYSLYADNRYVSIENSLIYVIENVMDSVNACRNGACSVSEFKITIKNGAIVKEASKIYDSTQGYKMEGAGAL